MLKISKISFLIAGLFMLAFNVHAQVTTLSVRDITNVSAKCGGATTVNPTTISEVGLCWGTSSNPNPTVDGPKVVCTGFPEFYGDLTNLVSPMLYYVRAYVITKSGAKIYGKSVPFRTGPAPK